MNPRGGNPATATLQLLVEQPGTNHLWCYWKISGPTYRMLFAALRRLSYRAYTPQHGWVVDDVALKALQMVGFHVEAGHLNDEELACADWVTPIFARDWLSLWRPCSW